MIKRKGIILTFLFFAWAIIFAHSIIPHHHHDIHVYAQHNHDNCELGHHHHNYDSEHNLMFSDCEDDCNGHTCHFHVDILTQISIDHVFIVNNEKSLFGDLESIETTNLNFYQEIISDAYLESNYLRGPPSIA